VTGARLGVDFGTSTTVAVLYLPDRAARPLVFDGSPLLPSAVCADPTGQLLVGRDAWHAGLANPAGFEPHPKRHIDEDTLLLGSVEVPVEEVVAAVLRRVATEAGRVAGEPVPQAVLTYPASWAGPRQQRLRAAATLVFPEVDLVPEPAAAASYFARLTAVPEGKSVIVYDLGAGTFDASVVRRVPGGFAVLGTHGLPDAGGLDIDAAIVAYLAATFTARDAATWRRLASPGTPADRRASRLLWTACAAARRCSPAPRQRCCTCRCSTRRYRWAATSSTSWPGRPWTARWRRPAPCCARPARGSRTSPGCSSSAAPAGCR
jgi:molecular chaperone DnaK (HSP70)